MKSVYTFAAVALLSGTMFASAAHAAPKASEFASQAAVAGKFEIESSQLALQKSKNSEIKAFANQMIADHTKADKELKNTLPRANVSSADLPRALDDKHQKVLDDLKQAKAEDFDKDYLKAQMDAHDEAVALFKQYADEGDNESLKKFAAKTLPTLEEHHSKVDALEKKDDAMASDKPASTDSKMTPDTMAK